MKVFVLLNLKITVFVEFIMDKHKSMKSLEADSAQP